jgi:hypothetical protein
MCGAKSLHSNAAQTRWVYDTEKGAKVQLQSFMVSAVSFDSGAKQESLEKQVQFR